MPANGNGVADVNIIPPSLIDSVEIITGGASAVYGSDALAGVVNFKLRRKFDGVEIDGTWGQTDRGDGEQYEAGLTAGTDFAGGRGSVVGFVGYADRELVTGADREFSKYPLVVPRAGRRHFGSGQLVRPVRIVLHRGGAHRFFPAEQFTDPAAFNALMASYGYAPGTVPYQSSFAFNADGTLFTPGGNAFLDSPVPAVANYRYPRDPVFFNDRRYAYNYFTLRRDAAAARAQIGVRACGVRPRRVSQRLRAGVVRRLFGELCRPRRLPCSTRSCR